MMPHERRPTLCFCAVGVATGVGFFAVGCAAPAAATRPDPIHTPVATQPAPPFEFAPAMPNRSSDPPGADRSAAAPRTNHLGNSLDSKPIDMLVFGDHDAPDATLIFAGIHGD